MRPDQARGGEVKVVRDLSPVNPGGSRSLHALRACSNAAELVSTHEPFATASMVNSPDASGSGNALTPLLRMHSANLTALL
jgi:hypothetical protein